MTAAQAGWVLIGSRETDLPLSSLILSGGASLIGTGMQYYSELKDYIMVTQLKAGEACWILLDKPCTITLPEE